MSALGFVDPASSSGFIRDVSLPCIRCKSPFQFSAKSQAYHKSKGFPDPKYCAPCRAAQKEERSNRGSADYGKKAGDVSSLGKRKSSSGTNSRDDSADSNTSSTMKRRKENEGGDGGSGGGFRGAAPVKKQKEVDEHKIEMRMKQIQFGYNTAAYDNYSSQVVKCARNTNYNEHPRTPDPYEMQSKRAFDGRIRKWRRELHRWDPQGEIMQAPIAAVKKNEASVKAEEEKEKEAPRGTGEEELGESLEQYGDDSIFEAAIKEEESDEEDIL